MKALLETRCGCTREVELPENILTYRIPLFSGVGEQFDRREFRFDSIRQIDGVDVSVFIEQKTLTGG